ncbi:MAG: FecCD family ABC transporter permease [Desulforhopalus sp.]
MISKVNLPLTPLTRKLTLVLTLLSGIFILSMFLGLAMGPSPISFSEIIDIVGGGGTEDSTNSTILLKIRLPRILLAALVGATLSLGGMVFQALLRNPLAEPYILGISGGSAVGAISGILLGLSFFPGVTLFSLLGSMLTLGAVLFLAGGRSMAGGNSLLLGGVMMNAFCGAFIMFLISISQGSRMQQIIYWLMGDLSMASSSNLSLLLLCLPCFIIILLLARPMNIILAGKDAAMSMGVNVRLISTILLVTTSVMVSIVVCQSGLIGFVGLLIPHLFRMCLGADHRLLGPSCILGGSSFLVVCDLLARTLPQQGEMPVGIITALIGAPLFIFLLWRARR